MTPREFIDRFVRLPDPTQRGRLARMKLYPAQAAMFDAVDQRDETGQRQFREIVISLPKKAGKSSSCAVLLLWGLIADDLNPHDREVILVANDLAQARDVTFQTCKRIVERDPLLSQMCQVLRSEIVYREEVREERTGGLFQIEHVLRAVPRDIKGLHGTNHTLVCFDEAWGIEGASAEILESLAVSPARNSPLTVYASYAGLLSQQREGVPWYDLMQRVAKGDDPHLYALHLSGPDAWREVPWITEKYVESQRRMLRPSQFRRLIQNLPAIAEDPFLAPDEILDAIKAHTTDGAPDPRQTYYAGLDLGVSRDWAAFVIGHVDAQTRFVVDVVRQWVPTPSQRVSLHAVEQDVIALAKTYRLKVLRADSWQSLHMVERFQRADIPCELVTFGPHQLDAAATQLKALFADRLITIPPAATDLRVQLESLQAEDIRTRGSRTLVRFQSGKGRGAAQHDDLAVALQLAAGGAHGQIGVPVMPSMTVCQEAARPRGNPHALRECFLFGGRGELMGDGCYTCPARVASEAQFQAWRRRQLDAAATDEDRRDIERTDLRTFTARYMKPSTFVAARRMERCVQRLEGYG
ncbi:hypothetical protein TBR22_A32050 [Luteitalea sp. TBR-22]|uniref:terminase large subunit domain-containing protein n=1 Tax=Luteitalea sp. TBR-22 TaxID=2802971 RepID=UPI001AFC5C17|nr:terminase large subunit [Luteitalea sp. TBR-22]BCS33976.1 hypothetical protein TBR22_A32050 [Luteitalea sp. TBR-22]